MAEKAAELIAKAGFDAYDFSMIDMVKYDYKNKCVAENDSPYRPLSEGDIKRLLFKSEHSNRE